MRGPEAVQANPAAEIMENELKQDIVVAGTVVLDGETYECLLEQTPQPHSNIPGDVAYRIYVKGKDGLAPKNFYFSRFRKTTLPYENLLVTFKRTEKPLIPTDNRVKKIVKLVGARNLVNGVAIYRGKIAECTLLQRITDIGHAENVMYDVHISCLGSDNTFFRFMRDGTPAYQEDPGVDFWTDLDTTLDSFKEAEDPVLARLTEERRRMLDRV